MNNEKNKLWKQCVNHANASVRDCVGETERKCEFVNLFFHMVQTQCGNNSFSLFSETAVFSDIKANSYSNY